MERVPAEAEVVHDPRREVLEQHVGVVDEPEEQVAPLGAGEVEGDAALVVVRAVVQRAPLPPAVLRRRPRRRVAHEVGAGDRLDLDHVGAERAEHVGRGRSGPPRGAVDHAHAVERERGRPRRRVAGVALGPRAAVASPDGARVSPSSRRGARTARASRPEIR